MPQTQAHKKLIKGFKDNARHQSSHSPIGLFGDWLECSYTAFAKTTNLNPQGREELEARYMRVVKRYEKRPEIIREFFPEMLAHTLHTLIEKPGDFLGECAGEMEALNSHIGQFFTPFAVSRLMAEITYSESICRTVDEKGYVTVMEPACGSGGMIIALCTVLEERGYDPETCIVADCTDLSDMAFKMCFLQLEAIRCPAVIRRGNSLSLEVFETSCTSSFRAFQLRGMQAQGVHSSYR